MHLINPSNERNLKDNGPYGEISVLLNLQNSKANRKRIQTYHFRQLQKLHSTDNNVNAVITESNFESHPKIANRDSNNGITEAHFESYPSMDTYDLKEISSSVKDLESNSVATHSNKDMYLFYSKTLCSINKLDVLSHVSVDIQHLPIIEYITNCFHEGSVHVKTFIGIKLSKYFF